jgi:hypothetical protein
MPITLEVEYTDTFGGEANYCWVKRATLELPDGLSDAAIMRRAKKAIGISGMRGRSTTYGDCFEFMPYGHATVMFATVRA